MTLLLHGLSIKTYYSIIIVISCTLMINKVTQTRCSSMYFFLLTQYTALKVLFQQRRTWTPNFFSSTTWIRPEKRTLGVRHDQPRCWCFFWLVWFIPEILEQTSDWEWHKTSLSRVHHVKIYLILFHVPTFSMGFSKKCPRSGPLNLQRQVLSAEGKTRYMKFELFQNSRCHFN